MSYPHDAVDDEPVRLVATLWQRQPPGGDTAIGDGPDACVADLQQTLATLAREAAHLAAEGPIVDRAAAHLLAETARAIHDALDTWRSSATSRPPLARGVRPEPVTPWVERLRFARMERWLAARAEVDSTAEASAHLCLWVIEHLETAIPPTRPAPRP